MKIHILAICGTMTTPLALALKKDGHTVTGSDQNHIYPPFSQILHRAHISINPKLDSISPNLVIVGSAYKKFRRTSEEFVYFKKHQIPYISATRYLADNLIKENSILVAGSYGKTTITAALSWVLSKTKLKPSYFFGGQCINRFPSLKFTSSDWSVVEADESINGLDSQAKFLYYPVKYLILTSAFWEHCESYSNPTDNTAAFVKLIKNLPKDGLLIYNRLEPSATKLIKFAQCPRIPYQKFNSTKYLFGKSNQNNLAAVTTLCSKLGLPPTQTHSSLNSFRGVKRRLELISTVKDTYFYDDFAQSPHRIKESLLTLQKKHPDKNILVIFEAHATFLQYPTAIMEIGEALRPATKVFLSKLSFSTNLPKSVRTTSLNYKQALGDKLNYLPIYSDLQNSVLSSLESGDILVHLSSGGLPGIKTFKQIIKDYKFQPKADPPLVEKFKK